MNIKFKSPVFWIGVVAAVFLAAGIDPESLTNWPVVVEGLKSIVMSPVKLMAVIGVVYGIFNDNSTKGLDKLK